MEFRSTNYGFASPKDIQSNVGSSHGVQLSGGSTGGVVQPCGDDANITLTLRGKGTGGVVIGSTAASGSTGTPTTFKGFYASTFTGQFGAISSGQVTQVSLSTAFGGFALGDLICIDAIVTPAEAVMTGFRSDADATSRVTILVSNPGSTATSTGRVVGTITWADLT